jgi:Rrf2 family protein
MLALTKATGYGILSLGYLDSRERDAIISAREISEVFSIPNELLAKVLQRLTRAGLLEAHQGRGGGYSIACDTSRVSVAEVVEAVEGPISIATCLKKGGEELCDQWDTCTIKTPVGIIQDRLAQLFASITVREITTGVDLCPAKDLLSNTSY